FPTQGQGTGTERQRKRNRAAKAGRKKRSSYNNSNDYKSTQSSTMTVANLSNRILNNEEESLLALGLSFCPTNNFDYVQTRIDLFHFTRKLKLKKWYKNKVT
ncbi:hypothetical protein NDU88_006413, partial [Pleurodeles waltl]